MKNFIYDSIIIDFEVPKILQNCIDEAEKADAENSLGTYLAWADNLDTVAKNCCAAGAITEEMWNTLNMRYVQ